MDDRRIALVPPRYGPEVVGGAEAVLREAGAGLAARGWDVEVLTTCARDHYTWANAYPPGRSDDGAVTVHRFPVVNDTGGADRAAVEAMLACGDEPTVAQQERWMNDSLRVPDLYHWLLDHAEHYRALLFAPYLFWTTFACGQVAPERSILVPCAHPEPYLDLELFDPLFTGATGLWFLTEPERDLVLGRFPSVARSEVTGAGVPVPERYDPAGFRRRHRLGERRFVVAGGRREGAKGWEVFVDAYTSAVRRGLDLDLVTFGVGEVHPEPDVANRVIDLGFVSDEELADALAAAEAFVQPSALESFSRMIMEAWLAGSVVVANGASDVVAWHCDRSGAGLVYRDAFELEQCLRLVAEAPELAAKLAAPGRDYVLDNYRWPTVLDRMEATLEAWL